MGSPDPSLYSGRLRLAGASLVAAAVLFWVSWLLMPGVGITDAERILELVATRRSDVLVSSVLQTVSAVLYVPAILGVVVRPPYSAHRSVAIGAGVFLVGAMGSAADAVYHLLAYAMTAPGTDPAQMVPVMQFMQGPGLRLILPLVAAYFIGAYLFTRAVARARGDSAAVAWLYPAAVLVAIAGAVLASRSALTGRAVGLTVLFIVSAAQVWLGLVIARHEPSTSSI